MGRGWMRWGAELTGPDFAEFHTTLAKFNATRFDPGLPEEAADDQLLHESRVAAAEIAFIESLRNTIAPMTKAIPSDEDEFIQWFERLKEQGPGQGDPLFPWLATQANLAQMTWFMLQEVAGEAGFEDLLALTQVKAGVQAKLEMARNFWDEMGRGFGKGMHGPMLARLSDYLKLSPTPETVVPEALALGNTMIALAKHRRYAFHSIGALGAIEMTAPTRAGYVNEGLKRLGISAKQRHYFAVHAVLDVKHSEGWNREVLRPLVKEDSRRARALGEGAIMRLWLGARTFARYRQEFSVQPAQRIAA
jgi:Iron-containing redox enzyme